MEGLATFKYLEWPLDQTDDGCLAVRRNIKWSWKVWGRLGPHSGSTVIQGGDTGVTRLWRRDLGTFVGNVDEFGVDTHKVSK